MAQSTVNTPFGPIIVNHPDDAAEADILRFAELQANERQGRREQLVSERPEEFDPFNEEFRAQFGAADPSSLRNIAAGAGKGVTDLGRGLRQIAVEAADEIPGIDLTDRARQFRESQSLVRSRDADLLNTRSGLGGTIGGVGAATFLASRLGGQGAAAIGLPRVGSAISAIGAPTSFGSAAASGAVQGAIAPVTDQESRFANTALGAAGGLIGQGISSGLSRIAQPVRNALTANQDDAVALLTREGVDLDVGQRTGSNLAGGVRRALQDNPLTQGAQQRFTAQQQRQFTRAVLRTVGEDADEVTDTVLNSAHGRVGQIFDDAANTNPAFFDTELAGQISRIVQSAPDVGLDDAALRSLNRNVERIFEAAARNDGFIPGPVFTSVRSNLSQLSRKAPIAREMQEALMDALQRSGGNADELASAIAQFRNLRIIENSLDKGVDRLVRPAQLANTLGQARNRALSQRGLGHPISQRLSNLAQAGSTVFREAIGNSGTASRTFGTAALSLLGGEGFAPATLGRFLGVPLAAQRGLLSQSQFLSQGLQNPFIRNVLESPVLNIIANQGAIQGSLAGAR